MKWEHIPKDDKLVISDRIASLSTKADFFVIIIVIVINIFIIIIIFIKLCRLLLLW